LHARKQRTQVIVLFGGRDLWCSGMDLNRIEAADSPEDETWRNLLAMNDLAHTLITTESHMTIAALQGNASAGGMMLALGADKIYARRGAMLKPHYRDLGRFHGSELWTYTLPRRVGEDKAKELIGQFRDLSAREAQRVGLIDECLSVRAPKFREEVIVRALEQIRSPSFAQSLAEKRERLRRDEAKRPLSAYRMDELAKCWSFIFNPNSDYHEARRRLVFRHSVPLSGTQTGAGISPAHKVA
jgi:putative two-component system hydrogenase maturation factor HypX/HoxX